MKRDRFYSDSRSRRNPAGMADPEERYFGDASQFSEYIQTGVHRDENEFPEMGYERAEREMRLRRHDRRREVQGRNEEEEYWLEYDSPYGEHPASLGPEEYRGGNKRHPGLGRNNYRNRSLRRGPVREREDRPFPPENQRRRNHLREPRHLARREYEDYLNRGQYEMPFHGRDEYDPIQLEYDLMEMDDPGPDHLYRYDGYDYYGSLESFGKRSKRQRGQSWLDEDRYPHGHVRRGRGYGKYGSR